jgi:hypothetical protein
VGGGNNSRQKLSHDAPPLGPWSQSSGASTTLLPQIGASKLPRLEKPFSQSDLARIVDQVMRSLEQLKPDLGSRMRPQRRIDS